ncbi:MAG: hypothetical protein P9L92_10785 [Candidatus Electryonea clarkiae]|nr:hypothetical protein [Candidatus Electryonea clarkiae]MDP8287120.1 hypothetical protein [Candidatus Electryonea clarkiae]
MQKMIAVSLMLLFIVSFAFAKDVLMKGSFDMGLGGSFSLKSSGSDDDGIYGEDKQMIVSLNPDIGYFFIDKLSIGLFLDYNSLTYGDYKSEEQLIGPRANYYFPMKNGTPFLELSYGINSLTLNDETVGLDNETFDTKETKIGGGYLLHLNDYFGVVGKITYSLEHMEFGAGAGLHGNSLELLVGFKILQFK